MKLSDYKNTNEKTLANNCTNNNLISDKNTENIPNNKINNDIRNETNIFLKSLFRDFRKSNSQKINFKRILKSDNNNKNITEIKIDINANSHVKITETLNIYGINNERTYPQTLKNNTILEDEFPEIKLDNYPKEDLYKRILLIFFGVIIFLIIFGLKFLISEMFQIPTFCDLKEDWNEFDLEVKNKTIIQLYDRTCKDKCIFTYYVLSKVFQFDHLVASIFNFIVFFKNSNILNRRIVVIYLILFPILLNLLKFVVFFRDKTKSYLFITIFNLSGIIIFLFHSKQLFLYTLAIVIPVIYFSFVRLFFEYFFIKIYVLNPEINKITIPITISLLRFIYFKIILQLKIVKNIIPVNKFLCVMTLVLYEFSFIGILHNIAEEGFTSKSFYLNILIDFVFDLNNKFQIFQRTIFWISNLFKKKLFQLTVSDFEKIYIELSIDMKIYSIFIYLFLISFKYFNYTQIQLTDCFGIPLKNKVRININHLYLFGIMFTYSIFKFFFEKVLIIILKNKVKFIKGHFPKLENKWHIFSYYIYLIGAISILGYPGFYFILNLKNS